MITLSSYLPTMPVSRQELSETLSDDLLTLQQARAALSNAWAHRMSASLKAHFAAISRRRITAGAMDQRSEVVYLGRNFCP